MAAPRRRPRDRKAMILRVAAQAFATRGYPAVSVTDIAEGVGISPGALYRHFPGKEGVLEAVLLDVLEVYGSVAREATAPGVGGGDPSAVLRRLVADTVELTLERPAMLATFLREHPRIDASDRDQIAQGDRALFRCWDGALDAARPGISVGERAARLEAGLGALVGMSVAHARAAAERTAELTTNGVLAVLTAAPSEHWTPVDDERVVWRPEPSRRQELLFAAIRLFRERGYEGVGIDDIGEAVGISGPGVYAWFDSKSQLLIDAMDLMVARIHTGLKLALTDATDVDDALIRMVHGYVDVAMGDRDLMAVASRCQQSLPPDDQQRIARRSMDVREPWRAAMAEIRSDLSAEQRAVVMEASLHLVRQVALSSRPSGPSRDAIAEMALLFLRRARLDGP